MAVVLTGDADYAADAAQEGFVKAYRALDRFDAARPFRPWLLRIVANEARNSRKALNRRADFNLRLAHEVPRRSDPSPEASLVAQADQEELVEALNKLRTDDRGIITMRYFLELSEAEMAEALRVRRGTVKSRLSRALSRLRDSLAAAETSAPRSARSEEVRVDG